MSRLTNTNMTAVERKVFAQLQSAVGFAPKVMFGRDSAANNHILARVLNTDTASLYAIATAETPHGNGVREYRLLVATLPHTNANGTTAPTPASTRSRNISKAVKASWAGRRAKYGKMGRRWLKRPADAKV